MEDTAIVDLYWQRSETAIAQTALKYGAYCHRIACNILNSAGDAEECVNDTYLGAWNAMPSQRPAMLKSFVGKITRNIALSRLDYNSAQKRDSNMTAILSELDDCLSPGSVEGSYEEKESLEALNEFLQRLSPVERKVFVRRYWYADTVRDVAERFNMSESKVKSMLFRLRKRLHRHLKDMEATE